MPPPQAPEGGKFLKGLSVVNGVAYFGVSVFSPRLDHIEGWNLVTEGLQSLKRLPSPRPRSARQDPAVDSELAAFDLETGKLIWRRTVPTKCVQSETGLKKGDL